MNVKLVSWKQADLPKKMVPSTLCSGCLPFLDLMFLETSALTGEGVSEVFLKCARTILSKIESGMTVWKFWTHQMQEFWIQTA
jgi:hypothetical protein